MSANLRRWIGRVALTIFLGSLSAPLFALIHLAFDDDAACGTSALGPRHPSSQFETTRPAAESGHCAICHWMRAVGDRGPVASYAIRVSLTPGRLSAVTPELWTAQASFAQLPPRAPPIATSL